MLVFRASRSLALLSLLALACQGRLEGGDSRDAGRGSDGGDAGRGRDSGTADSGAPDSGLARDASDASDPGFDAGPCEGLTLATALSATPLAGLPPSGPLFASPTDTGGVLVAAQDASGASIRRFGGDGTPIGAAASIAGGDLYGFDASADTWAVLITRGTDALYFAGVDPTGASRFEVRLLGEVDHAVTNNEWFGTLLRAGRLLFTGTRWAAYYTVNRLWPDGIAHYGDQLRFFDPSGAAAGTAWDWGCSHSMEVRMADNGTTLAPVCASDCYPAKGIHVNHRSAMLYPDEGGSNCAGRYGTSLGGVVPMDDGFWVSFTATDARTSHDVAIARVANDFRASAPIWLTSDDHRDANVRAARYDTGFVVAWTGLGDRDRIARFDASGAMLEGPIELPALGLSGSSDFFVWASGDVGWITGGRALARLRVCR